MWPAHSSGACSGTLDPGLVALSAHFVLPLLERALGSGERGSRDGAIDRMWKLSRARGHP